ncbi:hypothetical protein ACI78V_11135 [Geodermatophilus sp. SYSU D00742]
MRVSFAVYGVLYVVAEIVGARLESVGWPRLTPLDVATAVTDACLTVAVGLAVLVGLDLGGRRWQRWVRARRAEQAQRAGQYRELQPPIGVPSWRAEPLALPAGPAPAPARDYSGTPSGGRTFPEEPGRLL